MDAQSNVLGFRTGRKYAITWCKKAENYSDVKALECYDEAIKRDPEFAEPWYGKGKIFAAAQQMPQSYWWAHIISPYITGRPAPEGTDEGQPANKYRETLKMFNKATELDPKFVNAWYAKGDFYFGYVNGEGDAVECFDKAIALDSKFEPAWYGKAQALAKLGKHEEALKCCDKAIALLPADAKDHDRDDNGYYIADRWCRKADALAALGRDKEALKCYDEIIEMKYRMRKTYALGQKGITLAKLGKHEEALKCYDEATKEDYHRGDIDLVEMDLAKANALSELGGSQERMLKCYSDAISRCTNQSWNSKRNPVDKYDWEEGVKKLQETCSRAMNGFEKYYHYDEEDN